MRNVLWIGALALLVLVDVCVAEDQNEGEAKI